MSKTIQIMIDKRGTVTNGDVIKAVFPSAKYYVGITMVETDISGYNRFNKAWWNSPYKECDKNDNNKV